MNTASAPPSACRGSVSKLLVLSQVVLSLQLPFAMFPLVSLTARRDVMGVFSNASWTTTLTWLLFALITAANVWLVWQALSD